MDKTVLGARNALMQAARDSSGPIYEWMLRRGALALNPEEELPYPTDAPFGHAPGHDPDRVLMIGAGAAYGWGVTSYELSLCGSLARALSVATGRGCDVELLTHADLLASEVQELVGSRRLDRYDAIVFVLGVNDAIRATPEKMWRASLETLIAETLAATAVTTELFFVGIQPIRSIPRFDSRLGAAAATHAATLNAISELLCSGSPRCEYLPLPAAAPVQGDDAHYRSAAQYDAWAAALSPRIADRLTAHYRADADRRGASYLHTNESVRQASVEELPLDELALNPIMTKVVAVARRAFGVQQVLITIIDRDRQHHLIRLGSELAGVSREDSFCSIALEQREPLIVRDTLLDERFRDNSLVVGEPRIRFYAGIPITSRTGERIGALCIIDNKPRRRTDDINIEYLRSLSALVTKEIWKALPIADSRRTLAKLWAPRNQATGSQTDLSA